MLTSKCQFDWDDIQFNLFELFQIHQKENTNSAYQYEKNDLRNILEEFSKFSLQEIFPTRAPSDEEEAQMTPSGVVVPQCLHPLTRLYYENGWFGLGLSSELGGTPVPQTLFTACASLSTACNVAWMMYPGLSRTAVNILDQLASPQQKETFIPKLMAGEWGGTMCLTEADAGSDVGALRTTATPLGNGRYSIKGTKIFISNGENDLYKNIIHLVLARTPQGVPGTKGLSLFIVPRYKLNSDGSLGASNDILCSKIEEKMGIHASATCELRFGENGQCEGLLLGKEFEGMNNMFIMMNEARLMCGLQGESQAHLAYMMAKEYAKERVQFGKAIIEHPDVQKMLLKMRAMSRGLRSLCLYTANLLEKAHTGDQEAAKKVEIFTPICKAYCTDEGFKVTVDALQVHGGYGYCREYGIEQFVRDAKIATIYEGTNAIQANDFIVRKVFKDNGASFQKLIQKVKNSIELLDHSLWKNEIELFHQVFHSLEKILHYHGGLLTQQQFNQVLLHATDLLQFCGHLFVGWNLANAVVKIQNGRKDKEDELSISTELSSEFYKSKILDFKIFCNYYLKQNIALAEILLNRNIQVEDAVIS